MLGGFPEGGGGVGGLQLIDALVQMLEGFLGGRGRGLQLFDVLAGGTCLQILNGYKC